MPKQKQSPDHEPSPRTLHDALENAFRDPRTTNTLLSRARRGQNLHGSDEHDRVQEAALKALEREARQPGSVRPETIGGYLHTAVGSVVTDRGRQETRRKAHEDSLDEKAERLGGTDQIYISDTRDDPQQTAERKQSSRQLRQRITRAGKAATRGDSLNETILYETLAKRRPNAEVAEELGISRAIIKQRKHSILKRLRGNTDLRQAYDEN